MPIRVGQGMLFGCIVYWIVGLRDTAAAFFKFVALLVLDALASQVGACCLGRAWKYALECALELSLEPWPLGACAQLGSLPAQARCGC